MCGICGMLNFNDSPADSQLLGAMLGAIRHRGPDDWGLHTEARVGLAHARLSLDLRGGHQPMSNHDGSLWIALDGEIFNSLELREELLHAGRKFVSASDTEVLLQLYEAEGQGCVQRLQGEWAFALYDRRQRKLFLSRDRMGARPLFYCRTRSAFLFASEIKALFAHPAVSRQIDLSGMRQAFTLRYTVPPRTTFAQVRELPPAHWLVAQDHTIRPRRYWQLGFSERYGGRRVGDEQRAADQLGELLTNATRSRFRGDVPVGAYLDGSLPSSFMVAVMRRLSAAPLHTFALALEGMEEESGTAEGADPQQVAALLGTTHHRVRCTPEEIGRIFPEAVWHAEKPLLRPAPADAYLLAKQVRNSGFKVTLSGEGAEQILGGSAIFLETRIRSFCAARPESRRRPLLLRCLDPRLAPNHKHSLEDLRKFFHARPEDLISLFFSHLARWEAANPLELLFAPDVVAQWRNQPVWEGLEDQLPFAYDQWDVFHRAQYLETAYQLPGEILSSQGDRPAMAHGVEERFPFLDPSVVEFAASLPSASKMRGLGASQPLQRLARRLLPQEVLRQQRRPRPAPLLRSFLTTGSGRFRFDYLDEVLAPEQVRAAGIFRLQAVRALLERLRKHSTPPSPRDSLAFAAVVSTQLLHYRFISHFRPAEAPPEFASALVHPGP